MPFKRVFAIVLFAASFRLAACADDAGADTASDAGGDGGPAALFGSPNEKTGLTEDQCVPWCDCDALVFTPPQYTEERIQAPEFRPLGSIKCLKRSGGGGIGGRPGGRGFWS